MRKLKITFLLSFFVHSILTAGIFDSLDLGISGGFNNYKNIKGEIFLNSSINLLKRPAELRVGLCNRDYELSFANLNNLKASSIGIFGDLLIYPFNFGLNLGIRWELVNLNWLNEDSKSRIDLERDYSPFSLYYGSAIFFQIGYDINLSNVIGLKIYGQRGIHYFSISNGSSTSGSYSLTKVDFIYNLNIGITFKIK